MGIKFLCPNGHKLHVKAFLAGKRAICPHCSARVVVPYASTRGPEASVIEHVSEGGRPEEQSIILTTSGVISGHAQATSPAPTSSPPTNAAPTISGLASASHTVDAIDEAPDAIWYVRPATGGQFGPASGEIMRAWVREGRVGASSLVWRAGWEQWQSAATTFPQLGGNMASPRVIAPAQAIVGGAVVPPASANGSLPSGHPVQLVAADATPVVATPSEPVSNQPQLIQGSRKKQRRSKNTTLIASGVLVLVSIILIVILVLVWQRQDAAPDGESAPKVPQVSEVGALPATFDAPRA